jgi:hypothetical protein
MEKSVENRFVLKFIKGHNLVKSRSVTIEFKGTYENSIEDHHPKSGYLILAIHQGA